MASVGYCRSLSCNNAFDINLLKMMRGPLTDADFKSFKILLDIFIENKRISLSCAKIVFKIRSKPLILTSKRKLQSPHDMLQRMRLDGLNNLSSTGQDDMHENH